MQIQCVGQSVSSLGSGAHHTVKCPARHILYTATNTDVLHHDIFPMSLEPQQQLLWLALCSLCLLSVLAFLVYSLFLTSILSISSSLPVSLMFSSPLYYPHNNLKACASRTASMLQTNRKHGPLLRGNSWQLQTEPETFECQQHYEDRDQNATRTGWHSSHGSLLQTMKVLCMHSWPHLRVDMVPHQTAVSSLVCQVTA